MATNDNNVQVIRRAFDILELLRDSRRDMGVNEIARLVDLNVSTVHRLLKSLISVRAIRQDERTRLYNLAPSMLLYGKAVIDQFNFIARSHPFLGELSKSVGETAFMGILDNFELVYVDHVDSLDHSLRMTPQIGRRQYAHCTSLGKTLLANLDIRDLNIFLDRTEFPKVTINTISTPEELRVELEKIRNHGYAFDQEEAESGICCVAAPIIGLEGKVIAAISVSGPATRLRQKGMDTFLLEQVLTAASRINKNFIS